MGKNNRKYYVSEYGNVRALKEKSFLVYWKKEEEHQKQKLSQSSGPYKEYKEAEKIMIEHLISGVCSWIVSYNG